MFDWDDLRYFLAVARHGSTLAAAQALKVNQSTVQRRLTELERRIGRKLARRHASGYRLTDLGREMVAHAEGVERAALAFEQHLGQTGRDAVGVIRVTCPEPIVFRITQSSLLDRFHARYPQFRVEFVMSDKYLDLPKGEADVALRSGDTDDGELVGRKLADSLWAVYASRRYIEQHGRPERVEDLGRHFVVGLDEIMAKHRAAAWLARVAPEAKVVARNNSILGLGVRGEIRHRPRAAADRAGRFRARPRAGARPDPGAGPHLASSAHPDLRRAPRIAAFFDFIMAERDAMRSILTG